MSTVTTPAEVRDYLDAVISHLAGLPEDELDDLTIDLEGHLVEVQAEGKGTLVERLGSPEQYAAELRASAGLDAEPPRPGRLAAFQARWSRAAESATVAWIRRVWAAMRPAWVAGRGWLALASFAVLTANVPFTNFPIPEVGGSSGFGLLVVAFATWASIRVAGQGSATGRALDRTFTAGAGLLVVLTLIGGGGAIGRMWPVEYVIEEPSPLEQAVNIYPYDLEGNPLSGVLLFDQDGNPIDLYPWQFESTDEVRFPEDRYGQPIKNAYPLEVARWIWDDANAVDRLEPMRPPRVATPDLNPATGGSGPDSDLGEGGVSTTTSP